MRPVAELIMRNDAQLSRCTTELVDVDARGCSCGSERGHCVALVGRRVALPRCPVRHPMWDCGHHVSVVEASSVSDLAVVRAVEFDNGDVVSSRTASRLDERVERLLCCWVATGKVGVEGARMRRKDRERVAQGRMASQHVDESATVAETCGEDASSVNAVGGCEIGQQGLDETNVVHVPVLLTRDVGWVGFEPKPISIHVGNDRIWVDPGVIKAGL